MRLILPSILILTALGTFFVFTNPKYQEIQSYKDQISQYDDALNNEIKLEQDRDALSNTFHSFPLDAQERLLKMLPDNADNIRLVIDIQKLATQYGVNVMSISFDNNQSSGTGNTDSRTANKDYGVFNLEFSISGSYNNFLRFLKAMESSLRVNDVQSIAFSSSGAKDVYTYDIKIKTYWLMAK